MSKFSRFLDKGRQVVDLTKMGVKIEKAEENIEKLYANLGRVFYKIHDKSPEIMYDDLFRTISGSALQLQQLKDEFELIKGKGKCRDCNIELKNTDCYCANCGTAVIKINEEN